MRQSLPINEYSYDLPEERIAKYPSSERGDSKLLVYKNGDIGHGNFKEIGKLIRPTDMLIFNNTKVIPARMQFSKATGATIEIFCLSPVRPSNYEEALSAYNSCRWKCIVGNQKKWKTGKIYHELQPENDRILVEAELINKTADASEILFSWKGDLSFGELLKAMGNIPIPPYLNRATEEIDKSRYQTIYSKAEGSVAAPTAGLHFTPEIMDRLQENGTATEEITLHVGAGTFKPVKSSNAMDHKMHGEVFSVSKKTIEGILNRKGDVIATGTTTLRTLESLYWIGVKSIQEKKLACSLGQWEYNDLPQNIAFDRAFRYLLKSMNAQNIDILNAITDVMIVPGYTFKAVDALVTNFHQPQSTLLLLIAAFVGDDWRKIYGYAMKNGFRFLSYGDSSILFKVR